jgi:hypothetical protein
VLARDAQLRDVHASPGPAGPAPGAPGPA